MATRDESGIFPGIDAAEAGFLLREMEWGSHFVGAEMSPGAGNRDAYLYSLSEAERFLRRGMTGTGLTTGGGGTIVWFDFDSFASWVEDSLGDHALAEALRQRGSGEDTFFGKAQVAAHLLGTRLSQLREAVESESAGNATAAERAEAVLAQ